MKMGKFAAIVVAFVLSCAVASAQNQNIPNGGGGSSGGGSTPGSGSQPYNYTPLTPDQHNLGIVTSTALTVPATALQAVVCAAGNNVNYTYDGTTAPTITVGMPLATGQCIQFSGATVLSNLRFIQKAATATLDVSYTK